MSKQEFEELKIVMLEMDERLGGIGTFIDNAVDDDDTISLRLKTETNFVNIKVVAKVEFPYLHYVMRIAKRNI